MNVAVSHTLHSNDLIQTSSHSDFIVGSWGDDFLQGHDHNDTIVGGDGNDDIRGGNDDDLLLGDWSNSFNGNSNTGWTITPEDTSHTGNDDLYGGDGSDIIIGGPGNDQIDAGPRGDGWLDDVTGGPGKDVFLLSYNPPGQPEGDTSFLQTWGDATAVDEAGSFLDNGIETLERMGFKKLLQGSFDAFEEKGGGMLMGPLGAAGFSLGESLVETLLAKSPKAKPPPPQDTLVIRDFDPRDDMLVLPLPTQAEEVKGAPAWFASSAGEQNVKNHPELHLTPRVGTWGLSWSHGDNSEFAEVFLSDDYLKAMGVDLSTDNSDKYAQQFLSTILSTAVFWNSDSGMDNPNAGYAFSLNGTDPNVTDFTPSSSESTTVVFGALSGWVITAKDFENTDGARVGGTNLADVITANDILAPADQLQNNLGVTKNTVFLYGFGGDDEIYGNNGSNAIYGGDGNDRLYAVGIQGPTDKGNQFDELRGDAGDDTLVSSAGTSAMDGGKGNDTVSYVLAPRAMIVDLSTPPDFNDPDQQHNFPGLQTDFKDVTDDVNTYFTGYASDGKVINNIIHYDALANIENIIGSKFDDTLIGNGEANIIDPGLGNDTIDSKGGGDILSYASLPRADTSSGRPDPRGLRQLSHRRLPEVRRERERISRHGHRRLRRSYRVAQRRHADRREHRQYLVRLQLGQRHDKRRRPEEHDELRGRPRPGHDQRDGGHPERHHRENPFHRRERQSGSEQPAVRWHRYVPEHRLFHWVSVRRHHRGRPFHQCSVAGGFPCRVASDRG